MSNFGEKLKAFLHDPVDKCVDIPTHIRRAKDYAEKIEVVNVEQAKGPDIIASCMERSLLPAGISQDFNEIRHPLSEGKMDISNINSSEVFSVVSEVFKEIGREISSYDDERKFLYIWRNLLIKLIERSRNRPWCKYIPLFPADTRVPDHSIWEHLKVSSAVNAYLYDDKLIQNNSLFLFTIGPVQSFISQARKAQDLYIGSFLLSYLTFIGMKVIINEYGPTSIIYPDLFNQPLMDWFLEREKGIRVEKSNSDFVSIPTIPNRFVAIIPESETEKIKQLAERAKEKIFEELSNILDVILQKLSLKAEEIKDAIVKQLVDFPQVYWVAVPWRKGEADIEVDDFKNFFYDGELKAWKELWNFAKNKEEYSPNIGLLYQLLYTVLEKWMGARKNLRKFKQVEETGRKCSLCGERNVLFFWEKENKKKFTKYNPEAIDLTDRVEHKYFSSGEGLCGLCFIKRTFKLYLEEKVDRSFEDLTFPSTAEVTVADFKKKALKEAREKFEEYENLLKNSLSSKLSIVSSIPKLKDVIQKTVEGELFFEENLEKESIKEEFDVDLTDEQIKQIKECLKQLSEKVGKPNPYYALIYLDGDNMGKWLSGELLPKIENTYNSEVWRKLPEDFKEQLKVKSSKKLLTPAIHASISNALRNYSIEFVKKIVEEEHLGKLIYTGGDDVLAFVNLRDLLDVMEKLRFAFSGETRVEDGQIKVSGENQTGFVEKDGVYYLTMGKKATASMGVVIAHYKEPLKMVIGKVFQMEKMVKSNTSKDSFSILLIKKSGEERIVMYKWIYKDSTTNDVLQTIDVIKRAKNAMDDENERHISHGFIQKLKREFLRLKDKDGRLVSSEDVFNGELYRLISRAYNYKGSGKDEKNKRKELIDDFYTNIQKLFWKSGGDLDNFTNLLEIVSFLNKRE
ncbi:MAG: type III-B CRISPR-associated protein Cas10/Cmr2 [Caldisericia bacterium]|jgi:CRISPR-associated protein Cmr2|nr:type III-B CRISPR-associated protein Cas10/Cmr2 [Caldisericia bacterium]